MEANDSNIDNDVYIKIESLHLNDETITDPSATATVAFGGSLPDMQIHSSKLCPSTGLPVIESQPPASNSNTLYFSNALHLLVAPTTIFRKRAPVFGTDAAWQGPIPDILEVKVRYGQHRQGVGFLVLRGEDFEEQDILIQWNEKQTATLRVSCSLEPPSVTACSDDGSSSTNVQSLAALYASQLQEWLHQHTAAYQPMAKSTAAAACTFFNWEQFRHAVQACHPGGFSDDMSTIATRESWGEF